MSGCVGLSVCGLGGEGRNAGGWQGMAVDGCVGGCRRTPQNCLLHSSRVLPMGP